MIQSKRWLLAALVLGVLAVQAMFTGLPRLSVPAAEAAFPGPDNLTVASQQCLSNGTVRVTFSFTSYNTGPMWVDLTIFNNGFAPNTFVGIGPLQANQNSQIWDGLIPNSPHYARINALVAGQWFPSNTAAFVTINCVGAPTTNFPGADNLRLVSQECLDGRVRITAGWTASNQGLQWLDLSIFNNGWAGGTYTGLGPLPQAQTQQIWEGLLPGTPHFMRVNTATANGWFPSNTISFTTPTCPVQDQFTTAAKSINGTTNQQVTLVGVTFGAHADENFDRLVYEFAGGVPNTVVQYGGPGIACGSGMAVPVSGAAHLEVSFQSARAHTDSGTPTPTIPSTTVTGSGLGIVEAKQTCDFEGLVEWNVGTDQVTPFRIFSLSNPSRVVIDVRR